MIWEPLRCACRLLNPTAPLSARCIHDMLRAVHFTALPPSAAGHYELLSFSLPPGLLVQHVASTVILVLNWRLDTRGALAPKNVNEWFRSLTLPAE